MESRRKEFIKGKLGRVFRKIAPIAAAVCLASCGVRSEAENDDAGIESGKRTSIKSKLEKRNFSEIENRLLPPIRFGGPSNAELLDERRDAVRSHFRKHPIGSPGETRETYLDFFRLAEYANGETMFPGLAEALDENYQEDLPAKLAARRAVSCLSRSSYSRTYSLLKIMPRTSLVLADKINQKGSGMEIADVEDMASFFYGIISYHERTDVRQRCRDKLIDSEKLREFDRHYYKMILENGNDINLPHLLCRDFFLRLESGELDEFGFCIDEKMRKAIRAGECIKREREDPKASRYWCLSRGQQGFDESGKCPE